jgi:hypothetical protein
MSGQIDVGKNILSYCGKCKLTLAHTVVSMKDTRTLGKVKCNTCQSIHMYKDPSTSITKSKVTAKKNPSKAQIASKSLPISEIWMTALNTSTKKSQAYSPKSRYIEGDVIDHVKFGPGIVQKIVDGTKIEVVFRHEIKTLIHDLK